MIETLRDTTSAAPRSRKCARSSPRLLQARVRRRPSLRDILGTTAIGACRTSTRLRRSTPEATLAAVRMQVHRLRARCSATVAGAQAKVERHHRDVHQAGSTSGRTARCPGLPFSHRPAPSRTLPMPPSSPCTTAARGQPSPCSTAGSGHARPQRPRQRPAAEAGRRARLRGQARRRPHRFRQAGALVRIYDVLPPVYLEGPDAARRPQRLCRLGDGHVPTLARQSFEAASLLAVERNPDRPEPPAATMHDVVVQLGKRPRAAGFKTKLVTATTRPRRTRIGQPSPSPGSGCTPECRRACLSRLPVGQDDGRDAVVRMRQSASQQRLPVWMTDYSTPAPRTGVRPRMGRAHARPAHGWWSQRDRLHVGLFRELGADGHAHLDPPRRRRLSPALGEHPSSAEAGQSRRWSLDSCGSQRSVSRPVRRQPIRSRNDRSSSPRLKRHGQDDYHHSNRRKGRDATFIHRCVAERLRAVAAPRGDRAACLQLHRHVRRTDYDVHRSPRRTRFDIRRRPGYASSNRKLATKTDYLVRPHSWTVGVGRAGSSVRGL